MSGDDETNIRISHDTWQRLNSRKTEPGVSLDDVIQNMLAEVES